MKSERILIGLTVAIVGFSLAYNTDFGNKVEAAPIVKTVELPALKSDPSYFKMNLDLQTGHSIVESNVPITSTDITVNRPTKVVEKVVYKYIKRKEANETKPEVLVKTVMFPLFAPDFTKPEPPVIPNRVYR